LAHVAGSSGNAETIEQQGHVMMKALPEGMFTDPEQSRFNMLRNWILENAVTEISMNEQQFWTLVHLQPSAEKPWTTFMGRLIRVRDMPAEVQKRLGLPGGQLGEI
jgi:hypothetical protein